MKIAPPESLQALEDLRYRLERSMPPSSGGYWQVMIYKCRWGWVARAQLRRNRRPPKQLPLLYTGQTTTL